MDTLDKIDQKFTLCIPPMGTEVPVPFWGICGIMRKIGIKSTGALRPHLPFQYRIHILLRSSDRV